MARIEEEIDSVELPAPAGWKKFVPKNSGIPRKNDVLFISPTGEKIRSRKQLTLFLRAHPGGPSPSEFDWRYGDAPRRSARINDEKKKVVDTPEEVPQLRKRKSKSNDRGKKHQKNGGDTEKEENDEVPESKKTAALVVESIADAEMKDVVEDSSIKEQVESAVTKTIEEEIEVKVADHDSVENQEGKNINEPEKLQLEDSNKDTPSLTFAPEETSAVIETPEELVVEDIGEGVPVLNDHEESKKEDSYVSEHLVESKNEKPFVSEHEEKQGVEVGSNEAPVLFVTEATKGENAVVRENRVDFKTSPCDAESSKEVLREKEVKDRVFFNDSHKWEQKTVSSS